MKNNIKTIVIALVVGLGFATCDPQEESHKSLGNVVNPSDIKVEVTVPDSGKPNNFLIKVTTPNCVGIIRCAELGLNQVASEINQYIPWAGNYNLEVSVYNKAGISDAVTVPISVGSTDPAICDNELYRLLTGGCSSPNGKTWRIKGETGGHVGCGEEGSSYNNWWNPGPWELNSALYDDDLTFFLNAAQRCVLDNKGASFMNESTASLFPDGDSSGSFVTTNFTPSSNSSWGISNSGGSDWLTLTGAFPGYAVNTAAISSGRYKIVSITETDMHIVFLPGGISWHYYLTSTPRP